MELFKNERLSKFDEIKNRQKFFIQFDQKLDSSVGIIRFFEGMDRLMSMKMHNSLYEVGEEMMQKLTYGLDQMYGEEDTDGNEVC